MKELIAFLLPPAVALTGMRLSYLLLGREITTQCGYGLRFAIGLAVGMLVFSQTVLLGALAGVNLAGTLAWIVLIWGLVEFVLMVIKAAANFAPIKFQRKHLWLLLLLPVIYSWWVFGRLSTLEGTLEGDAVAFWVFKAKILYLEQGKNLLFWLHQPNLAYTHWDYPMLVSCLYTLNYGLVGDVDEFINKVWPFWMIVSLCLGILSLAKVWKHPHPLPLLTIIVLCFLPATLHFIRQEGGTIPMVFYVSLTALLIVKAISNANEFYLAAAILTLAGGAMTKFEGAVYAAVWFCVLLPFCWRRGWLKKSILWKSALVAVICLLPYVWFRLDKPILHPESGWWRAGLTSPTSTAHQFPQVWFLNVGHRFFSYHFFQWQSAGNDHLQWTGKWIGLNSFVSDELSFLPWLLIGLLTLSLWKGRCRLALGSLTIVMIGVLTILSLAISCLPRIQGDLSNAISISCEPVERYFYPFFVAWFLGITITWFNYKDKPTVHNCLTHHKTSCDESSPGRSLPCSCGQIH